MAAIEQNDDLVTDLLAEKSELILNLPESDSQRVKQVSARCRTALDTAKQDLIVDHRCALYDMSLVKRVLQLVYKRTMYKTK